MKKRTYISALLMGCLLLGTGFSVTSCKDYDDDINNLQSQIDDLNKIIEQIKTQITGGSVISKVEKTGTGVKITLSNGQTYELSNGKDGTAWTIGDDGYWYKDGAKTDYKAKGDKGDKGDTGATGADGVYYEPNVDGYFYKVSADGSKKEKTNISWKQNGGNIYAVMDKDNLTLYNIPDANGTISQDGIKIALNANLRGLVFAGDRKVAGEAEGDSTILRAYIDGVPGIRVAAFDYKAQTLSNINSANEIAKEADKATRANRETYAYYHVNPANANLKDLEKLTYEIKANADYDQDRTKPTRAAASSDFDVKIVEFNNETGILKVKLDVTGTPATAEKISVAALQAHKKNNEVVTSDYAAIYNKNLNQLRLADKDRHNNKTDYHYRRAVVGISHVDPEAVNSKIVWDPAEKGEGADIKIQYNTTTDLNKYVEAHELGATGAGYGKCTVADLDALGFKLEYTPVTGYKIGSNSTPQDEFITVSKDGKVTPKVFTQDNPTAAINRTPIVRVALIDTRNKNQVVQYAYIKLRIVNETPADNKKLDMTIGDGKFHFSCDKTAFEIRSTVQQMNEQLYNKVNMSREDFHTTYSQLVDQPEGYKRATNPGEVKEVFDENPGVEGTTRLFAWTLTDSEMWANAGKTVQHTFQYLNPTNHATVTITLKATIEGIKNTYALTSADYWSGYWKDGIAQFNVNVPEKVGETDPSKCVFTQDLNAPFKTTDGKITAIDKYVTYSYYFNDKIESVTKVGDKTVKFEVKDGGEGLYATVGNQTQKVATIHNNQAAQPFNWVELDKNSDVAKALLNTNEFKAYISIKAYACGDTKKNVKVTFNGEDYYTALFVRPITIGAQAGNHFEDGRDLGEKYTFMKLEDLINPTDWRGREFTDHTKDGGYNGTTYWQYYGPFTITANVDKAEWNMNGSFEKVPSTVELKQVNGTSLYGESSKYGFVTYRNNQYVLNNKVTLKIPVTVQYGWGETSATVEVDVQPTKK